MYEEVDGVREYTLKVLVVGDIGTGKTSFVKRIKFNAFEDKVPPTVGVDFLVKRLTWDDKTQDIAGQERFGNLTRVYFKDAVGAFILFDITRRNTFEGAKRWKQEIDKLVSFQDKPIPVTLLANKVDLEEDDSKLKGLDNFCRDAGFIGWLPISVKQGLNIDKGLTTEVRAILENVSPQEKPRPTETIKQLNSSPSAQNQGGCCT